MDNLIRHEIGGGINKTKLIYNKKLIKLLDETRKTYNIQNGTLIDEELAAVLREHLDLVREEVDLCYNGGFGKSDYYAFIVCLCFAQSVLEECNDWEDFSKTNIKQNVSITPVAYDTKCCCGHNIRDVYKFDGNYASAIVGNVCVEKSTITNSSVIEKVKLLKKKRSKDKSLVRRREKIAEEDKAQEWYKNERRCLGTDNKICKIKISRKEPEWKARCISCYKEYNTSTNTNVNINTNKRTCIGIGDRICEKNISSEEPEWKKRCNLCYKEYKKKKSFLWM